MNRRLMLAGLAATGGLLTTAFLQAAVAVADVSADGADAFTIGAFTFDPFTVGTTGANVEGFTPADPVTLGPPLLTVGGGDLVGGVPLASQDFEVFDPSTGADLGSIDTTDTDELVGSDQHRVHRRECHPCRRWKWGPADSGIGV